MREMPRTVYQLLNRWGLDRVVGAIPWAVRRAGLRQAYPSGAGLALMPAIPPADTLEKRQSRLVQARQVRSRGQAKLASQMPAALTPNPVVAAQVSGMILANPKQGIVGALLGMAEREDTTRALASIQVPALVVAGSEDRIVSPETAAEFIGFFPRGWMVEAPGAGHLPMMEPGNRGAAALRDLIRGPDGRAEKPVYGKSRSARGVEAAAAILCEQPSTAAGHFVFGISTLKLSAGRAGIVVHVNANDAHARVGPVFFDGHGCGGQLVHICPAFGAGKNFILHLRGADGTGLHSGHPV